MGDWWAQRWVIGVLLGLFSLTFAKSPAKRNPYCSPGSATKMNNLPLPGQANVDCIACSVDKYQTTSGVWWYQLCSNCPAGYRSPPRMTSCSRCSEVPCMTVCNCPTGKRWGGTSCIPVHQCPRRVCIAGRYQLDLFSCGSCRSGLYQPEAGQHSCLACSTGKYSESSGLTTKACITCPAGYFSSHSAGTECTRYTRKVSCGKGEYNKASSSTDAGCVACPNGYHQPFINQHRCSSSGEWAPDATIEPDPYEY
jgi:hypothetical protein